MLKDALSQGSGLTVAAVFAIINAFGKVVNRRPVVDTLRGCQ